MQKKEETKKRINSIDFLRAVGILSMIQIHMGMYLTEYMDKHLTFYKFMNNFGQIAAPFFLTTIGISLMISLSNRKNNAFSHIGKRSLFLIFSGLLFINIWQADILHYIGIYLLIAYLFTKLNKFQRTINAVLILVLSQVMLKLISYTSGWEVIGYKLANFWTLQGFLNNLLSNGFYPMFPWLFFPVVGTIIGEYLLHSIKTNKESNFIFGSILIGIILTLTGIFMNTLSPWKITFYPATITYAIFHLGIFMISLGTFYYLFDNKNTKESIKDKITKLLSPITYSGTIAFSIYILHVIIGLGIFELTIGFNHLPLSGVIAYTVVILILLGLLCKEFVKKLNLGPFEYLLKKCCD